MEFVVNSSITGNPSKNIINGQAEILGEEHVTFGMGATVCVEEYKFARLFLACGVETNEQESFTALTAIYTYLRPRLIRFVYGLKNRPFDAGWLCSMGYQYKGPSAVGVSVPTEVFREMTIPIQPSFLKLSVGIRKRGPADIDTLLARANDYVNNMAEWLKKDVVI